MNIDDVIMSQLDDGGEACGVCGKSVAGSRGYVRLGYEGATVALCCPLCLDAFQSNPRRFVGRQKTKNELHDILNLLKPS
jgi:YHS domain-containing protein